MFDPPTRRSFESPSASSARWRCSSRPGARCGIGSATASVPSRRRATDASGCGIACLADFRRSCRAVCGARRWRSLVFVHASVSRARVPRRRVSLDRPVDRWVQGRSSRNRRWGPRGGSGFPTKRRRFVQTGLYGRIRNPIYTGFLTAVLGLAALAPSALSIAIFLGSIAIIRAWVGLEEARQLESHGDEFRRYCASTGRFLPRLRARARSQQSWRRATARRYPATTSGPRSNSSGRATRPPSTANMQHMRPSFDDARWNSRARRTPRLPCGRRSARRPGRGMPPFR